MSTTMKSTDRLPIRRIVTGHDAQGKAIVAMQGEPPHVIEFPSVPGTYFFEIWKTHQMPATVDNGPDPTLGPRRMKPTPQGCAMRIVQIAPEKDVKLPSTVEEMEQHFRETGSPEAATSRLNAPHPLMHRTETLDFGILIDGELTLVLDDSEVKLAPGDIVVQRGTNHAWSNRGDKPCRIAFVLLDGQYSQEVSGALAARGDAHREGEAR
jgi:mannose-6-phosphate isomerase-like protein (cupin superfamily)